MSLEPSVRCIVVTFEEEEVLEERSGVSPPTEAAMWPEPPEFVPPRPMTSKTPGTQTVRPLKQANPLKPGRVTELGVGSTKPAGGNNT